MARRPRVKPTEPPPPEIPRQSPFPVITGGDGDDQLSDKLSWVREANTTNDRITGGAGNDNITSTGGVDFIDGGSGTDVATVFLDQFNGGLTVVGEIGSGQTATFSNGTVITNVEQTFLHFGAGNDNITFASGQFIHAGDGNDRITLTAGNGIVDGGGGNDILITDSGNDILRGGFGDDVLKSGAGNDELFGDDGADCLEGGAGDDRFFGGAGADTIIGGSGADRFGIADGMGAGIDVITDFNYAEGDRIDAFFQIFPANFDSAFPETATVVADPVGQGFLTVTQVAGGVLVALTSDPSSGIILLNTSLDTLPVDFII